MKIYNVYLSDEEGQKLKELAQKKGLKVASFVRMILKEVGVI